MSDGENELEGASSSGRSGSPIPRRLERRMIATQRQLSAQEDQRV